MSIHHIASRIVLHWFLFLRGAYGWFFIAFNTLRTAWSESRLHFRSWNKFIDAIWFSKMHFSIVGFLTIMFGVAILCFCSPLLTEDIPIDTLSKYLSRLEHLNSVSRGRPLVQGTFVFDSLICIGNCLLNLYCENAHVQDTVSSAWMKKAWLLWSRLVLLYLFSHSGCVNFPRCVM